MPLFQQPMHSQPLLPHPHVPYHQVMNDPVFRPLLQSHQNLIHLNCNHQLPERGWIMSLCIFTSINYLQNQNKQCLFWRSGPKALSYTMPSCLTNNLFGIKSVSLIHHEKKQAGVCIHVSYVTSRCSQMWNITLSYSKWYIMWNLKQGKLQATTYLWTTKAMPHLRDMASYCGGCSFAAACF